MVAAALLRLSPVDWSGLALVLPASTASAGVRVSCPDVWRRAGSFQGLLAGERRAMVGRPGARVQPLPLRAVSSTDLLVSYRR